MPVASSAQPAAMPMAPATISHVIFSRAVLSLFITLPACRPRIIVPSVGMKLSVAYPPPLNLNHPSGGNRFRNHVSKAHARLVFLFQWAAKPWKL